MQESSTTAAQLDNTGRTAPKSSEGRRRPDPVAMDSISSPWCVSVDLEVSKDRGRIHALGAVRSDTGHRLVHTGSGLAAALARLDNFADGASFVLGHNLIAFDLPHLAAAKPDHRLLKLPAVDTLRLSPLAFPANRTTTSSSTTRMADSSACT